MKLNSFYSEKSQAEIARNLRIQQITKYLQKTNDKVIIMHSPVEIIGYL